MCLSNKGRLKGASSSLKLTEVFVFSISSPQYDAVMWQLGDHLSHLLSSHDGVPRNSDLARVKPNACMMVAVPRKDWANHMWSMGLLVDAQPA